MALDFKSVFADINFPKEVGDKLRCMELISPQFRLGRNYIVLTKPDETLDFHGSLISSGGYDLIEVPRGSAKNGTTIILGVLDNLLEDPDYFYWVGRVDPKILNVAAHNETRDSGPYRC